MSCHAVFPMFFSGTNLLIANELRVLIEAFSILPIFMYLFPSVEVLMSNKTFTLTESLTMFIYTHRDSSQYGFSGGKDGFLSELSHSNFNCNVFHLYEVLDVGKGFYSE